MKSILDLKKEFKKRKLKLIHCVESVEDLNDHMTIDLLKRGNVDASLVALTSVVMNIASSYNKKQFVIDLLSSALATVESEKFKEDGNKLN
jgi:hypothetical protein|tara:strand:- start:3265 stop:3537 length:273 start_codon:yes stop_codon:yes gene_type:complete